MGINGIRESYLLPFEPSDTCVSCGAKRPVGDLLYDDNAEVYVCDRACFDGWHDENAEVVGDYYYRMNIE